MGYEGDRLQGVGLSGRETGGALGWRSLWGQPRPVRPGSALFLQDLLGLLLLFPLVAHVAEGAEVRELRPPGPAPGMYEARTEDGLGWGRIWESPPSLRPLSGRSTARRTPGSRSWSLCEA